jgi:hypothetical protein
MVVGHFNVESIRAIPAKADPVLVVDANTVLSGAISLQLLQAIVGRDHQILQCASTVKKPQLPQGYTCNGGPPARGEPIKQFLGIAIAE